MSNFNIENLAVENIPVILALVGAIKKVIDAKQDDDNSQLDALENAAEIIKERMDKLKFG